MLSENVTVGILVAASLELLIFGVALFFVVRDLAVFQIIIIVNTRNLWWAHGISFFKLVNLWTICWMSDCSRVSNIVMARANRIHIIGFHRTITTRATESGLLFAAHVDLWSGTHRILILGGLVAIFVFVKTIYGTSFLLRFSWRGISIVILWILLRHSHGFIEYILAHEFLLRCIVLLPIRWRH